MCFVDVIIAIDRYAADIALGREMRMKDQFVRIVVAAFFALGLNGAAYAAFPERAITIVVGFAAGGLADQGARIWADSASKILGKPVIIFNRVGGSGIIAADYVAKAEPDGYSLCFFTPGPFVIQPFFAAVPYKVPDSFVPIITEYINPIILAASADAPYNTVQELIQYAKKRPGELNYSASAFAGIERFGVERLQQAGGFKLTLVPYKGSGESVLALLGGHVQLAAAYLPDLKQFFLKGLLKPIVSLGFDRSDMPDFNVPTARESGFDVVAITYSGLLAPKGTPKEIVDLLHDAFKKAQDAPEFKAGIARLGMGIRYTDGAQFLEHIKSDYKINEKIIHDLNLSVDR